MMETETIWICESGEYEQAYTFGAWRSRKDGIAAVKAGYTFNGQQHRWEIDRVFGNGKVDEDLIAHVFWKGSDPQNCNHHAHEYFHFSTLDLYPLKEPDGT